MSNKRCLLIVEDEPDLKEIISDLCIELAETIFTASDGVEAMQIIQNNRVDAILSDINMPRMNGLQLLSEIRTWGFETPFVILSGFGDKKNTIEALKLGATDFLDKPFDESKLISIVDIAISLGVALREAEQEIDIAYSKSELSPEKLKELKQAKRTLWLIKKEFEIRNKKAG